MSRRRGIFLKSIQVAYPGTLGIAATEFVTYQTIDVTYNGVAVTYVMINTGGWK